MPKLVFPGGALIGGDAGFLNVPQIKGSTRAMKTGMLAAEAAFDGARRRRDRPTSSTAYPERAARQAGSGTSCTASRNVRPWLRRGPVAAASPMPALDTYLLRGKAPWTLHHTHADHETLKPAAESPPIDYPKPDGKLTFDRLSSVFISQHQPRGGPAGAPDAARTRRVPVARQLRATTRGPEQRYCPAGVYEYRRATATAATAAADQRAELRALQDLRHQGPDAEHRLGHARGRRRAELSAACEPPQGYSARGQVEVELGGRLGGRGVKKAGAAAGAGCAPGRSAAPSCCCGPP